MFIYAYRHSRSFFCRLALWSLRKRRIYNYPQYTFGFAVIADIHRSLFPEVYGFSYIQSLESTISKIILPDWLCNDTKYVKFDFSRFSLLQSLEIGNDSFRFVKTFVIDGLHQLKSLKIGRDSFTQVKLANWENDSSAIAKNIKSSSKSFHLLNCEQLETLEIGECSFSDYSGGFEVRNLPELLSVTIGKVNSMSRNFYASSFVIRGETLLCSRAYD